MIANDQRNCNVDAEVVQRVPALGDACDPQPCADGWIENRPSGAPRIADVVIPVDGTALTLAALETGFRFCPCAIARGGIDSRLQCEPLLGPELAGGCVRARPDRYVSRRGIEPIDWRFVTLDGLDPNGEHLLRYDLAVGPTFTTTWDVSGSDRPRWSGATFGSLYPSGVPAETPIAGVMWHRTLAASPFVRELTNHYSSNLIAESNTGGPGISLPPAENIVPVLPLPMNNDFCPYCGDWLPVPWLVLPCAGHDCTAVDPASPAVALGGRLFTPRAEPSFDPPGFSLFGSAEPTRWAAVAEQPELAPDGTLRFVGLSSIGAAPVRLLAMRGATVQTFLKSECPQGQCIGFGVPGGVTGSVDDVSAALATVAQPDPPRHGYAIAASAHWASAWIAGGTGMDGAELHDIWRLGARSGTWREIEIDRELGRVLAVAYSPSDAQLYVLDELVTRHVASVRLLRLPPEGGHAVVEASWRRSRDIETAVMAADASGNLWVGASQRHSGGHAVMRLRRSRSGSLLFDGRAVGAGALQRDGAYAARRGLSLAVRVGHRVQVLGYAASALVPHGCGEDLF